MEQPERREISPAPGAPPKPAIRVDVLSESGSTEVKLSDGSIIRLKNSVLDVWRFEDSYDENGNPLYNIRAAIVPNTISTPEELRKKP